MEGIWPPLALSFLLGEKGYVAQKQPCQALPPFRLLLEQGLHWHWGQC